MLYLLLVSALFAPVAAQERIHLQAAVHAGESFRKDIGSGLVFVLEPEDEGWVIQIQPKNWDHARAAEPDSYIGCVTPPAHGPHPTNLFAWHFVTEDNQSRLPEEKEIFPRKREFNFVLTAADNEKACEELEAEMGAPVKDPKTGDLTLGKPGYKEPPLGSGVFWIKSFELSDLGKDKHAKLKSLSFEADIVFPHSRPSPARRK
jgi:hypothetical protein